MKLTLFPCPAGLQFPFKIGLNCRLEKYKSIENFNHFQVKILMKLRSQSPQAGQIVCGVVSNGPVKEGKIGSSLLGDCQ